MDLINQLIFVGALLIVLSVLAGMVSSRLGAPLLLVFLVLGMLAGEDGILGIQFGDYRSTFAVGSIGSAASTGSALSAQSRWSLLSYRSYATQMAARGAGRIPVAPAIFVALGLSGLAAYLRERRRARETSHLRP